MSVEVYSVLGQTEMDRKTFWGESNDGGGGGQMVRPCSRALGCYKRQKTSLFVKFEIIPLPLCYLLYPFTNKYRSAWTSGINSVDSF